MPKVIILNGPPACGKDTAAKAIADYFGEDVCKHMKFSQPLKAIVSRVTGCSFEEIESYKNKPLFKGMTGRDLQIHTYNQLAQIFGEDWLGRVASIDLRRMDHEYFVFSDGGRSEDITSFIPTIGVENLMVIQIMREGCFFTGDIRSYISIPKVTTKPIVNNDLQTFKHGVIDFAGEFFAE